MNVFMAITFVKSSRQLKLEQALKSLGTLKSGISKNPVVFILFLCFFLIANTSSNKRIDPAPLVQNLKCNTQVKHRNHSKSVFITV